MADASTKVLTSTQVTHIGSGALLAAASYSASTDVSTALSSTNLYKYPRADVQLQCSFSTSIASTSQNVYLFRRDLNFDGTSDDPIPTASNQSKFMGTFTIPYATTASTTHNVQITDVPLIGDGPGGGACEFYVSNGTSASMLAGWTLKVAPKTDVGATT